MLTIHGRLSSINVRKVVLAARWLELPFERVDVGGEFGGVDRPAFLALNPNAMVPVILEDDGFALWESNVIVRYLVARHGREPTDLRRRFDIERWMDWQQTTLNPAGRDAFIELVRTPADRRDRSRIDVSIAKTEALMNLLDDHLAARAFMVGDAMSAADIPIACELHRWRALPIGHRSRPNLDRWWDRMRELSAARGVLDLELR